jgi:hypothetical protein
LIRATIIKSSTRGTVGELLAAAKLLSLGVEVITPYSDCVGVDLIAVSNDFTRAVPIQIKTAMSDRQISFGRSWFMIPGMVLVWAWPFEARFFVFDGHADVEQFLGSSAIRRSSTLPGLNYRQHFDSGRSSLVKFETGYIDSSWEPRFRR